MRTANQLPPCTFGKVLTWAGVTPAQLKQQTPMRRYKDYFDLRRQRTILLLDLAVAFLDGKITKEQCDSKTNRVWRAWEHCQYGK